jgi:SanA protein
MNKLSTLKSLFTFGIIIAFLLCLGIFFADAVVTTQTSTSLYSTVEDIPHNTVGLLLGTSKYIADGRKNLFYIHRIQATIDLYEAQKIDHIIISGDNSRSSYDEPTTMKDDLLSAGIPEKDIYLDYAGFRTLDSVVRAKEIFGQESFTIISQKFHNERALYIAEKYGIHAVAFNAKDVSVKVAPRVYIREKLARAKMILDLIIKKQPKFLGEKILIE